MQADSVALGNELKITAGQRSICIGFGSAIGDSSGDPANGCVAIGETCTAGAGNKPNGIAIGKLSLASGEDSIAIGHNASNAVDHSIVVGDPAVVNIRPSNDGQCDLGTSGASFRDLYVSGSLVGANVVRSIFSLFPTGPVNITNTTVISTVLGPGLGSLSFAPHSTQGGTVLQLTGSTRANIKDGDAVQFFLVNGSDIGSGPTYTNSSGGDQGGLQLHHTITVYILANFDVFLDWTMASSDLTDPQVFQSPASMWDIAAANTLDFQVQWSVADPGDEIYCQSMLVTQSF